MRMIAILIRLSRPAINPPINPAAPNAAFNNPANNFVPPPQGFAGPQAAASDLGRVAITGGRATVGRGPAGIGMMGVSFEIEYRVESQPVGVHQYDLVVKTSRGRSKIVPPVTLHGSGSVGVTVPTMSRNDGPFEVCFEAELFGGGGRQRGQVSDLVAMPWTEAPEPQPQFGPPGFPNHPGASTMPGQPGYRPPGMPQIPTGPRIPIGPRGPRFGPRGRP